MPHGELSVALLLLDFLCASTGIVSSALFDISSFSLNREIRFELVEMTLADNSCERER